PAGSDRANRSARLDGERGWNQEDFARIAKLNRHTLRQILHNGPKRRLRNAPVSQCADALGLTVSELRNLPLDRLLPRIHGKPPADEDALKLLYERASPPGLVSCLGRNRHPAAQRRPAEVPELLDMQRAGRARENV